MLLSPINKCNVSSVLVLLGNSGWIKPSILVNNIVFLPKKVKIVTLIFTNVLTYREGNISVLFDSVVLCYLYKV
jgi:hypothetical protein